MRARKGEPLRVLVLATTFPATPGDGTPEFVLTLAARLVRRGASVTVLAPRTPGAARECVIEGVQVRRFRYFPRRWERLADGAIMANLRAHPAQVVQVIPLTTAFFASSLIAVVRARPNIVHAHWIIPSGLVARILRLLTRTPYVVTAHGADAYTLRGRGPRALKRSVLRSARATIPVSADIGTLLSEVGPVEGPVPMGVDVERIRSEVGARRPEPDRVLFIGRLVEKKGVDTLLHAAAALSHAQVVIAGGGPQEDDLRRAATQLGVSDRVDFLGAVTRARVMSELARASVIVLPSKVGAGGDQDGVPVVLAEAMAARVPVVVSDLGGLAEHVTDGRTGLVVPPDDPVALAHALSSVLGDPKSASARAKAAETEALPQLSIDATADRYLERLAT